MSTTEDDLDDLCCHPDCDRRVADDLDHLYCDFCDDEMNQIIFEGRDLDFRRPSE